MFFGSYWGFTGQGGTTVVDEIQTLFQEDDELELELIDEEFTLVFEETELTLVLED